MRAKQSVYAAESKAFVATQAADSCSAELSAVKQVRDRLDADLKQTQLLLKERTESHMSHIDQSATVQVSALV